MSTRLDRMPSWRSWIAWGSNPTMAVWANGDRIRIVPQYPNPRGLVPRFIGRLRPTDGGAELEGRLRLPFPSTAFFAFWFGAVGVAWLLFAFALARNYVRLGVVVPELWAFVRHLSLMLVLASPILLLHLRAASRDKRRIRAFIGAALADEPARRAV